MTDQKQWSDMYIRDYIDDTGLYPTAGVLSHSPDIIPYGTAPVQDPSTFISDANWSKDLGKDLVANIANYIYVRGQNLANKAQQGKIYLYYSKASLLLYPNLWQNNQIKTSDQSDFVDVSASAVGKKFVTQNPFVWAPEMISGDHYCLVARVATVDNPANIPQTGNIQDFAAFISNNPNFGWRNVAVVDAGSPTWTQTVEYKQGTKGGKMRFTLVCQKVPVGAEVSFSCGTPGPNPIINLPRTQVTNSTSFIVGISSDVPANFDSYISYSYWSNGHAPLPGFSIEMQVSYLVTTDNLLYSSALPMRALDVVHPSERELLAAIGPTKEVLVGSHMSKTSN